MMLWPARADSVRHVAKNMRERDYKEISALSWTETRDDLAEEQAAKWANIDAAYVVWDHSEGEAIAVFGLPTLRPKVVSFVFYATERWSEIATDFTRFAVQRLKPKLIDGGVLRAECASLDGYADVHKWLELLGLEREAVMRKYGKNGEDFVSFAWVAP